MSETRSDRNRAKKLKVLELYDKGYSYRKIASLVKVSLRDVAKYIQRISNRSESQSTTSINDEIVLEYRVNLLRSAVKDLKIESENLKKEVDNLRAQKYDVLNQLRARQSELDTVKRNLEYERFSKEILKGIFNEGQ